MKPLSNKMVVICLDGGTFDIIKPMVEREELPNISKLMSEGIHHRLLSTIPSETGPAFVTFMTGTNPGRHGITRFARKSVEKDKQILLNSSHITTKTLLEWLSEHGKKIISFGVPFTCPPIPINGVMISHWKLAPDTYRTVLTYPNEVKDRVIKYLGSINIEKLSDKNILDMKDFYERKLTKEFMIAEYVKQTVLFLMREFDWDFLVVHLNITDSIQHHYWKFMDNKHPYYDPLAPDSFKNAIFQSYIKADEIIGELLKHAGKDITTIIMSDHGFAPVAKVFNINQWLANEGFLKFRNISNQYWGWKHFPATILLRKLLNKLGMFEISSRLPWLPLQLPVYKRYQKNFYELIDWNKTVAYGDNFGVNINMKGREPFGIVPAGKGYEKIVNLLIDKLNSVEDTETSKKIVGDIVRKEDIYEGPLINEGTDVIPRLVDGYCIGSETVGHNLFEKISPTFTSGHHTHSHTAQYGMLIMNGEAIRKNVNLNEPGIIDLAPTIMYLMGLPVPGEMEGRILREAIRTEYLEAHPIITEVPISDNVPKRKRQNVILSKEETEAIKDQLKGLGYL